ncbi:hypothetical protein K1I37_15985 [Alicyclobacillus acidoterrestris]|uniref:Uncharacterized protein n=1 Tax=Alicyclobacillus acidoterrestris (strain ATCC 49025 / DSM 3922 / CIP 106132 / NCIMB 13137 / GD3B) TaxID=1356854 RepID=A0A9E6ZME0_ALIAG|nr:hypothetical protein [Alicyclobacillus acidoterrestris]UNO48164.1 hypothetical protein K1I37_15985 [Alicyclobacillus acidoterrestris]
MLARWTELPHINFHSGDVHQEQKPKVCEVVQPCHFVMRHMDVVRLQNDAKQQVADRGRDTQQGNAGEQRTEGEGRG